MKNLLSRGGIEIIAVFIGITGGLWSEKQIEHNKTLESEKIALIAIREKLVSDSTEFHGIIKSYESEQQNMKDLFKHIDSDLITDAFDGADTNLGHADSHLQSSTAIRCTEPSDNIV